MSPESPLHSILKRLLPAVLLTVAVTACGSNGDRTIDPTATYDVYGERFESGTAVPAPAVVAESEMYVGRNVIVEGMAVGRCSNGACWTAMDAGSGRTIEVHLPTEEGDALDVPPDVAGRRIVVAGKLTSGAQQTPAEALTTLGNRMPSTADTMQTRADSTFRLTATGVLIEKVRS